MIMDRPPDWLPKQSRPDRVADAVRMWWSRPLVRWFRMRGIYAFVFAAALYVATGFAISFSCAAQFMIGYQNPFDPPWHLEGYQQGLAIALRITGWIIVPAAVGSMAGLVLAEQLRRLFNADVSRRLGKGGEEEE